MRLKSVYIGQYKNLRDFTLYFEGSSFIDVFDGKDATGKSNLFEALIEFFRHRVKFDLEKAELDFNYRLNYKIDGRQEFPNVRIIVLTNQNIFDLTGKQIF